MKDQKKETERLKTSLDTQQRETSRLKGEITKERKMHEESTQANDNERVSTHMSNLHIVSSKVCLLLMIAGRIES